MTGNGTFNPADFRYSDAELVEERRAAEPQKLLKRRQQYAQFPMSWYERMDGCTAQTYRVAIYLLHLHWKHNGDPVKLANGMLGMDGVSRWSKYRALTDLEERSLISVEYRANKSPIITILPLG